MLLHGIVVEHPDRAAIRVKQAAHQTDGGCLPGAVRSNQAEHLAALHVQRDAVERLRLPVLLRDACELDRGVHWTRSSASTGIPCFSTPALLSTGTFLR